jgi:hypothetical protein
VATRIEGRATRALSASVGGALGVRRFADGEPYAGDPAISEVYCLWRPPLIDRCPAALARAEVPGFVSGTRFLRASTGLHLDLNERRLRAATIGLADAEADYTHGVGADRSSYFRLRGAVTIGLNLWRRSRVLLLRAQTVWVVPTGGAPVPFSELAVLGGPDDLRGFRIEAFRDYSSLLTTAEYRWPIFMWADGTLFVDYGGVFGRDYAGIGAARMQPDVGLGVRFRSTARFFLRAQVAYGFGDTWQFYISGSDLP